jgi:hypothetical protein
MSFTTFSAGAFVVTGFAGAVLRFFIIFNSIWGKDEPQTLRYAITLNRSMGADVRQAPSMRANLNTDPKSTDLALKLHHFGNFDCEMRL